MATIEIYGLSKRFGDVSAVNGLTFTAQEGAVTGFLGPNGADKSTTQPVGVSRECSGAAQPGSRTIATITEHHVRPHVVAERFDEPCDLLLQLSALRTPCGPAGLADQRAVNLCVISHRSEWSHMGGPSGPVPPALHKWIVRIGKPTGVEAALNIRTHSSSIGP